MFQLPPLTPFIRGLMIALFGIFVAEALLQNFLGLPVFQWLALNPSFLSPQTAWQLFTHVLVVPAEPGSVISLLLNLLFTWWIMAPFEARHGRKRIMELCVVSALSAAVAAIVASSLAPGYSSLVFGPQVITLSGLCAYAMLLPPHAELRLFGVLPMRPAHTVYLVAGFSLLGFLTSKNASQLAADLGAIGGGIVFARWWMMRAPRGGFFGGRPQKRNGPRLKVIRGDDSSSGRWLN